jgi:hypothetical protein
MQGVKDLALRSIANMIIEDTQASFTTANMSVKFLKTRISAYCDDVFTTQASARIVASFISHSLCFELENINFAELMGGSITTAALSQNYVGLSLRQRDTLLSGIRSLGVGDNQNATLRNRPLSGAYKVGSLARYTQPQL